MPRIQLLLILSLCAIVRLEAQNHLEIMSKDTFQSQINILKTTELIQSMSQRSEIMPSYQSELKALLAKQAYDFWLENKGEKYVSHKNVYAALYYANKYLKYDSVNFQSYNQVTAHSESVVSIKFGQSPDEFYSAGSDGRVLKWNLNDIKSIPITLYEDRHLIRSIDISYDNKILMVTTKENGIIFISTEMLTVQPELNQVMSKDPEKVQNAIFLPNEYKYLSVNHKGEVRIKGIETDSVYSRKNNQAINALLFEEESEELYLGGEDGELETIKNDLDTSYLIPELFAINALAMSSDKRLLAAGREKGDVILIDLKTKNIIRTISGHQSAVTDVDFSQNNQLLLTASRDGTTRIWDINNSRVMPIILDDHEDWVFTAKFTPNGDKVVTGSKDKNIRVWTIDYQQLADRICLLVDRNLTQNEWEEYIGSSFSYRATCPLR